MAPAVRNRFRNGGGVVRGGPRFGHREGMMRVGKADVGEERPPFALRGIEPPDRAVGDVLRGVDLGRKAEPVRPQQWRQLPRPRGRLLPGRAEVATECGGVSFVRGPETAVAVAVHEVDLSEPVVPVCGLVAEGGAHRVRLRALRYQMDLADRRAPVAGSLQHVTEEARIASGTWHPTMRALSTEGKAPVNREARLGVQVGCVTMQSANRVPEAASRSRCGVRQTGWP